METFEPLNPKPRTLNPKGRRPEKMNIDISKFENCHVLVVGDLMIDEYLWGEVDRISPEAPVQIVAVDHEDFTLGGAGNVINNLVALGARVSAVGVIGSGVSGKMLMDRLTGLGVDTAGVVAEQNRPTTKKTRIIADHQQVLRLDRETTRAISDETFKSVIRAAEKIMPDIDIVLFSDYGKGLMSGPLISKMTADARRRDKYTITDPKGLDFTKYSGTQVITPNKKEASLAAGIEIADDDTLLEAGRRLMSNTGAEKVLITCGKDGMVYIESDGDLQKISTKARQVYDVSGAGDTVLALLGLGIAAGMPFGEAVTLANIAAGIVVGKVGTATVTKDELAKGMQLIAGDTVLKQLYLTELSQLSSDLRKKGKRIVLTNGCFDVLHVGHVKLLTASKQLGDVLIVAVDDDESVRALKGPQRPVISADERLRIISALDSVDHVILFSTDELEKILEAARPEVLTKGSDYSDSQVQGREIVEKHGGRVELIPITENISSTQVINNIKNKTT
jgi:D-beta-D-heptose 7-phosphate kinase/D-beta-D-heptose 1-phosphate adenosyltransferase